MSPGHLWSRLQPGETLACYVDLDWSHSGPGPAGPGNVLVSLSLAVIDDVRDSGMQNTSPPSSEH